jgi:release factor glutamine methyltransferase
MTSLKFSSSDPSSVGSLLSDAHRFLKDVEVVNPDWHAELIVGGLLGYPRHELYLYSERIVPSDQLHEVILALNRRAAGEPTQYILGHTEFYGLKFLCDARSLIPRPETEILVEHTLKVLRKHPTAHVLDLGTGSGCIAVVLATEAPAAHVTASDVSPEALELARDNARLHKLETTIQFVTSNLFEHIRGPFDIITANLPYIGLKEAPSLMREVLDFEPDGALFGGEEGLDILTRAIEQAPGYLRTGGRFLLEIGFRQAERVAALLEAQGAFGHIQKIPDYQGHLRIVATTKL